VFKEFSPLQASYITTNVCIRSSMQYITVYVAHKHIEMYKHIYITSGKKTN